MDFSIYVRGQCFGIILGVVSVYMTSEITIRFLRFPSAKNPRKKLSREDSQFPFIRIEWTNKMGFCIMESVAVYGLHTNSTHLSYFFKIQRTWYNLVSY